MIDYLVKVIKVCCLIDGEQFKVQVLRSYVEIISE